MKQPLSYANRHPHSEYARDSAPTAGGYFKRIQDAIATGLQAEINLKLKIRARTLEAGWTDETRSQYQAATFTASDLARMLDNISLSTLTRELKRFSAPNPGTMIRRARLAYAKHLLINTRIRITNIAELAGYRSVKQFTAAFHRANGMSPSEFRRKSAQHPPQE